MFDGQNVIKYSRLRLNFLIMHTLKGYVLKYLLITISIAVLAACSNHDALNDASINKSPKKIPKKETVFGYEINDPYRWMEKEENELKAWMLSSAKQTDELLGSQAGRFRLEEATTKLFGAQSSFSQAKLSGDKLFYLHKSSTDSVAKLYIRIEGEERLIVDPAKYNNNDGSSAAIHSYSVSPSGKYIAFHISPDGSEVGTVRIIDTDSLRILDTEVSPVWGEFVASWKNDTEFSITKMTYAIDNDPIQGMVVENVKLESAERNLELGVEIDNGANFNSAEFPVVIYPKDSRWVLGKGTGARPDHRLLIKEQGKSEWQVVADYKDRISSSALIGNELYVLSKKTAPDGEVLKLDLNRSQNLNDATPVLGEGDEVLTSITAVNSGLFVVSMKDGFDNVRFVDLNKKITNISLPFDGVVRSLSSDNASNAIIFSVESPMHSREYFKYNSGEITSLGLNSATHELPTGYKVLREFAKSADGTLVPVTIYGKSSDLKDPSPTILYAYGGYGTSIRPNYRPMMFPFNEEGGIWVNCHVRGGGEKGRTWHEMGRGKNKPNGHADFIACAEHLVKTGRTEPNLLGAYGVSMGGVLVGPAVLKRPDLFGHAALSVAILNPTRILQSKNGANQIGELGDPRNEEDFKAILAMDAYEMLDDVSALPDIYLDVGLNDKRVDYWHTAKFAAKYLSSEHSGMLLIRADDKIGHGAGSSTQQNIRRYVDLYSFMLNRSGHPDFQSKN
ncbi:prolyl oligopeptidase family serine peptidase [Pseudoalteromonas sp. MTN2-4]|uniref:prolyl oligopeptidase family serine peptidase n=1 Tax=Pseudoalteromonas sp. MTN2-4 TaxID=3056555 RepID=UPI0036F1CDC2